MDPVPLGLERAQLWDIWRGANDLVTLLVIDQVAVELPEQQRLIVELGGGKFNIIKKKKKISFTPL